MKTDIDWKGIAYCWETLVKENQELEKRVLEQDYILSILKHRAKFVDEKQDFHDSPVPNCGIFIAIPDKDRYNETIRNWLEGNK